MADYTPTTEGVRDTYVRAMRTDAARVEFDRWLAEHDGQIATIERERIIALLQEAKIGLEGHDSAECKCRDYAKAYGWAIRDIKGQEQ